MTKEIAEMWADILEGSIEQDDTYIVVVKEYDYYSSTDRKLYTATECFKYGVKRTIKEIRLI